MEKRKDKHRAYLILSSASNFINTPHRRKYVRIVLVAWTYETSMILYGAKKIVDSKIHCSL
uniref:Uncharacterized protein n=1 Tax=Rhizophora mucronata TaxID=61149 RepID=A0A2P2IWL9_RHIMU